MALVVSLILSPAWWFYNTPEIEVINTFSGSLVSSMKAVGDLFITALATWLSATKSYDLFRGNKKREEAKDAILKEKQGLEEQLRVLKSVSSQEDQESGHFEDTNVTNKLLKILEERN